MEVEGGVKKDELQVNLMSGMSLNGYSETGSYKGHYESGMSKNVLHVTVSIHDTNFTPFIQLMISLMK